MTGTPQAATVCEHYWAYHVYGGLSVRLCQLCHVPDWDDLRGQLAEAVAAERQRIRQLAEPAAIVVEHVLEDGERVGYRATPLTDLIDPAEPAGDVPPGEPVTIHAGDQDGGHD